MIKLIYNFGNTEFEYPVRDESAYKELKASNLLEYEDIIKEPEEVELSDYYDTLLDLFESEANTLYEEEVEKDRDPYAYYGVSRHDFI